MRKRPLTVIFYTVTNVKYLQGQLSVLSVSSFHLGTGVELLESLQQHTRRLQLATEM